MARLPMWGGADLAVSRPSVREIISHQRYRSGEPGSEITRLTFRSWFEIPRTTQIARWRSFPKAVR